ncbi:MAG: hypothetical protein M3413_13080 [Bacteroidota bacterium]|jgi:hypothetical protein|nr:hypothetical protein [Bacteroidota bacterium]
MALSSTTTQTIHAKPEAKPVVDAGAASVLAALVLSVYAAQKSKKQIRQLRRKAIAALFQYKFRTMVARFVSIFSKNAALNLSNRTLLLILLGLAFLILLFVYWPAAIALLLLGILLVLLSRDF